MYTQGIRPSRIHGHMSQHTPEASAVLKICLLAQLQQSVHCMPCSRLSAAGKLNGAAAGTLFKHTRVTHKHVLFRGNRAQSKLKGFDTQGLLEELKPGATVLGVEYKFPSPRPRPDRTLSYG
jgi:hypothetical protein